MAKALELSDETLTAPPVPKAAQARPAAPEPKHKPRVKGREVEKAEPREPLQVRWPANEVKAVKLAAIQLDYPTVSDFMLACFHDFMKAKKV